MHRRFSEWGLKMNHVVSTPSRVHFYCPPCVESTLFNDQTPVSPLKLGRVPFSSLSLSNRTETSWQSRRCCLQVLQPCAVLSRHFLLFAPRPCHSRCGHRTLVPGSRLATTMEKAAMVDISRVSGQAFGLEPPQDGRATSESTTLRELQDLICHD